jgi:hypothetical protein
VANNTKRLKEKPKTKAKEPAKTTSSKKTEAAK